jgi:hypothetical protein
MMMTKRFLLPCSLQWGVERLTGRPTALSIVTQKL